MFNIFRQEIITNPYVRESLFLYKGFPYTASYTLINMPIFIEGVVDFTIGTDGLIYGAGGESNSTIFFYDPVSKFFSN